MIWTKDKPKEPGFYWVKMDFREKGMPFSNQPPRVVKVSKVDDGSEWDGEPDWDGTALIALEAPDYEDGIPMSLASEHFEWSSAPIVLPS